MYKPFDGQAIPGPAGRDAVLPKLLAGFMWYPPGKKGEMGQGLGSNIRGGEGASDQH